MGILDAYRIKKSLAVLLAAQDASSPAVTQAVARLKNIGRTSAAKLIDGFGKAPTPDPLVEVLATFLDNETFPFFSTHLTHADPRIAEGMTRVFTKSTKYDANRLLHLFADPNLPKTTLGKCLLSRKDNLNVKTLVSLLPNTDKDGRVTLLRLLDRSVTETALPELMQATRSDDPNIRLNMSRILSRFHTEAVCATLLRLLGDPYKNVRQAALDGFAGMNIPVDVTPLCKLLRDPEPELQAKALEVLLQRRDPRIASHLLEYLQDGSEPVRRAAGQVLNAIGDVQTIKALLSATKDKERGGRVRAIDALGALEGSKLFEAVLMLLQDQDEFIRGCAIEILSSTKDDGAFTYLVEALTDRNPALRERAAEALVAIGDKRAIPALLRRLEEDPQANPMIIRALNALGARQAVPPLLTKLQSQNQDVQKETLHALANLADADSAAGVLQAVMGVSGSTDREIKALAALTAKMLITKFGEKAVNASALVNAPGLSGQQSLLPAEHTLPEIVVQSAETELPPIKAIISELPVQEYVPDGFLDPNTFEPGDVLIKRYRIIKRVGQGGFGTVMLVEDIMVGEEIILKFLNPSVASEEGMIKRFIHELLYARRITHENVIRIHDFLMLEKSYAISMEYFLSHSLSDELHGGVPLQIKRGLKIVWDICRGMSAAHQAHVVHRDLKPPNILIDDQGVVKVVDFGLAAINHAESRLTRTGILLGTPTYMAPEQVRSRAIDARTDVYSLGVIMYEIFTGRPPYGGDDPMAVLFQHVEGKPMPPRQIQADITPGLEAVILKAMAVDPEKRYQSMDALRRGIADLTKQGGR